MANLVPELGRARGRAAAISGAHPARAGVETRAICSNVGRLCSLAVAADVAEPGADVDVRRGLDERLVAALEAEEHAVAAAVLVDVLDGVSPFDFALAGFVRLAVERRFRSRFVAPLPLDAGAVVLLIVIRPAGELGAEDNPRRRDRHRRLRLERELRLGVRVASLLRISLLRRDADGQRDGERARGRP